MFNDDAYHWWKYKNQLYSKVDQFSNRLESLKIVYLHIHPKNCLECNDLHLSKMKKLHLV